ncbi:MAG: 1-acyl-sn-glycerol-3-phosphate acyltransferase [Anaerolineales bacterium]|nr:1-acyl-sn-glycerol-3-phosphate acyltransferase [Anaerolineales bacterium]
MYDINSNLQELNETFLFELTKAMGLPQTNSVRTMIRLAFGKAMLRVSRVILGLDHEIERNGSMAGARWLLPHFVAGYEASGTEIIPKQGPLIIASNHPASYDAITISAYIPRDDYKIIIGEIPPYRYLPNLSKHAIFSPNVKNAFGRMQTLRKAIQHLKDGGALLIFPRGGIEPDPAFMPNPDAEFNKWSRSLEIFLKSAPETRVLVTTVSNVISQKIMKHPITWFRRSHPDKQRLAFMYQMIRQIVSGKELFGLKPRVTFGELLTNVNHKNILAEIEQSARRTLAKHISINHPSEFGGTDHAFKRKINCNSHR